MRKYFLSIVALVGMLFATSCQESLVEPQIDGTTTFTVQVPDQMGTKAIGGHDLVNKLYVEVYAQGDIENVIYKTTADKKQDGSFEVSINLIQDQHYSIIFWAQKEGAYIVENLRSIPMNVNHHNNESGAAFYAYLGDFVPSGTTQTVTLKRPFAQLNLGTTPASLKTDVQSDSLKLSQSYIKVGNIAESFNTVNGCGEGSKPVEFLLANVPTEKLYVAGEMYYYVSMDYLPIAGDNQALVTVEAQIKLTNNQSINHKFTNVPVRENYRTNIVGNLISSTTDFKVEVNDDWAGADYTEEYVAPGIRLVNDVYEITSEEGLWSLAELVNGGTKAGGKSFKGETIKLTCDIDLEDQPWTPISVTDNFHETFRGTFDGQGHTITGLNVNGNDVAGLFGYMYSGTIQNVIIDGADINSNHYAGGIVGWVLNNNNDPVNPMIINNCQVKNSTIASTPEQVNGAWDNGDKVGGIVGYAAYVGGDVLAGDDNTVKAGAGIFNCSVENTTIKAYRDFGGIAGYAKSVKIEQPTIQNVTLEQDLTHNYQTTTPTTFGQIIGRDAGGNIIDGVSLAVKVTTSAQLQQVVNDATTDITVEFANDLGGKIILYQKEDVKVTIDGKEKTYTGGIQIFGDNNFEDYEMEIKNINFVASGIDKDLEGCIYVTDNNDQLNCNARNVTIQDCTFAGDDNIFAAIRQTQGGTSQDWTIKDCEVSGGMHSFLQIKNMSGLRVDGCTVKSKNGANLNQTGKASFVECNFDVRGYAVRVGEQGSVSSTVEEFTFSNCQLKSLNEGGDAVIIVRGTATNSKLTFEQTTLEGDPMISGYTDDTQIDGIELPKPVAKVGNTEYYSIDEAIAAWTNNTTLTLLADVTLSDVVTLNSTEHHILDLSTFTMTAASGKNAFVIKACGTGDSERTAITINSDATNPGGINAGSKSIIYYKYADGGISGNDRPIIKINGGIFTGSTSSFGTAGIYVIGSAARKAATINISGGTFNCSINGSGKSKLLISGGVFHYSVGSQGDSTALRLISGGRFKSFGFMTADDNNTKFWIGTTMATSNVGVYVDDEGYFVIGGPVITQFENEFEAMINADDVSEANNLLKYSSAATYGLYYTKAQVAIDKFKDKPNVEVVIK